MSAGDDRVLQETMKRRRRREEKREEEEEKGRKLNTMSTASRAEGKERKSGVNWTKAAYGGGKLNTTAERGDLRSL